MPGTLLPGLDEAHHKNRCNELVILGAHPELASWSGQVHAFEGVSHFDGTCGSRSGNRVRKHLDGAKRRHVRKIEIGFVLRLGVQDFALPFPVGRVQMPGVDGLHLVRPRRADRRRCTESRCQQGVETGIERRLVARFHEQREIRTPVAGQHAVRAGCPYLRNVGSEVLHFGQGDQFISDELDVRPPGAEQFTRSPGDALPERVILVDQIDLMNRALCRHVFDHRIELHV